MHRLMDMTVLNSLLSGSSPRFVAVLVAVKMRTTTEKMPTVQGFPGFGGSGGSTFNFSAEFKKTLYWERKRGKDYGLCM